MPDAARLCYEPSYPSPPNQSPSPEASVDQRRGARALRPHPASTWLDALEQASLTREFEAAIRDESLGSNTTHSIDR
jgi:hypothetical protein